MTAVLMFERRDPNAKRVRAIRDSAPTMSVVVASCRERRLLDACLRSLYKQCREHGAEIVVARKCDWAELTELTQLYPFARFIASADSTIPLLRAAGLDAAKGDMLGLTEDHCVLSHDWLRQLTDALQCGTEVVGGAMDNAQRTRAVDWGAYFSEYGFFAGKGDGHCLPPLLTGANVAYSRSVASEVIAWAKEGEWENVIHAQLFAQGRSLRFLKTAKVYQNQNYRFWAFCHDRFVHGRDYARRRLADGGAWRWFYFVGSFLLPPVLTIRVARIAGTHHRGPFVRALPFTFAFLTAWAMGEAVGYWYGPGKGASYHA